MTARATPGQVVGRAGGGLDDASWAANDAVRRIGQEAEVKTGMALASVVLQGPSVLHDLRIPIPGIKANIDHIIVHGDTVLILDSKNWAPGLYWTLRGVTRRGLKRFAPADKKTLPMAQEAIERFLRQKGLHAKVVTPVLVVWSSGKPNFTFFRAPGGTRVVRGEQIERWASRNTRRKNAQASLLVALTELVYGK
ncbi:nuclease-related domain-containing protein [Leucobacter sp. HY1910]